MAANPGGREPVTNVNAPANKRPIWLMVVLGIVAAGIVVAIVISLTSLRGDPVPVSGTAPNAQPSATSLPANQAKATEAPTQAAVQQPSGGTGANYVGPTVTGVTGLAPRLGEVTITSDAAIQTRGGHVVVAARAKPSTGCSIKVQYLSGNATAAGLEPKTSDVSGNVSWTWVITQDTKSGTWPVTVTCGGATAATSVTVP